mgnify:CR=1 FL=1
MAKVLSLQELTVTEDVTLHAASWLSIACKNSSYQSNSYC